MIFDSDAKEKRKLEHELTLDCGMRRLRTPHGMDIRVLKSDEFKSSITHCVVMSNGFFTCADIFPTLHEISNVSYLAERILTR